LSVIEPTIEEKQKMDEKILLQSIDEMNKEFKRLNSPKNNIHIECNLNIYKDMITKENKHMKKNSVCDSLEYENPFFNANNKSNTYTNIFLTKDNDFESLKANKLSPFISKHSTATNTFSMENNYNSNSCNENFLNQNLINFDEILKLILIGEKGVGKSLFISNMTKEKEGNDLAYKPTQR
jgi:hypothetical protein